MIKYEAMSLFDAPKGSIIIHACNAQGVWGSGIAKEFKERYPLAYGIYQDHCKQMMPLGYGHIHENKKEEHNVGWIITSENFGDRKDKPVSILANTALALNCICEDIETTRVLNGLVDITVYSNKFNSGLFNVPWSDSVVVLEQVLKRYSRINWVICDPSLIVDEWA